MVARWLSLALPFRLRRLTFHWFRAMSRPCGSASLSHLRNEPLPSFIFRLSFSARLLRGSVSTRCSPRLYFRHAAVRFLSFRADLSSIFHSFLCLFPSRLRQDASKSLHRQWQWLRSEQWSAAKRQIFAGSRAPRRVSPRQTPENSL